MQKAAMIIIAVLVFSLFSAVCRAEEILLTLDEAINFALRDSRDILLKAEEVKKAQAKISEAQAGLFPTLNFTASKLHNRNYYSTDITTATSQVTLKQYLYKGGETINTIAHNKYKLKVSSAL